MDRRPASLMSQRVSFPSLTERGSAFAAWVDQVARYGFGKIEAGPVEEGALFKVVDLFRLRARNQLWSGSLKCAPK